MQSFHASWKLLKSLGFLPKISWTCKVMENEFCPVKSWKLKFNVMESFAVYLWST